MKSRSRPLRVVLTGLPSVLVACGAPQAHDHPAHPHHADHVAGQNLHKHHSAHHRFDNAAQWVPVFESAERDAWQRGDAVVAALQLKPTDRVADVGAGTGYFAVRFARAVPQGGVQAQDIEPDMVRHLTDRAKREQLPNVQAVLGEPGDPKLTGPLDLIFLCDVYHHLEGRVAWFRNVAKQLRPDGRVVIVDFTLGDIPVGPPMAMRVAPETMVSELREAGLELASRDDKLLPYQHLLVFRRVP